MLASAVSPGYTVAIPTRLEPVAILLGKRLGPCEIISVLGAGGMGEVYRARDMKLGRDVAIKVVPEGFARDAERMARFRREAKFLASLNQPNIASIYALEDSNSSPALVMELVEGPTLADRIRSGPIPIDEALPIARQICDALEYAHERGIVHRDLKPANVKVKSDDTVKILDFGLAKAVEGDDTTTDAANSPTLSQMATHAGMLLGTAAYMSPEQAKGKTVDRRTDIWAFGCVLYEMLTGKTAFGGETVTEGLAAILTNEPDWSQLPAQTPVRVHVLLQRCLQKDPKQRLRDIGDARITLDEVLAGTPEPSSIVTTPISAPSWRPALLGAVTIALASVASFFAFTHFRETPPASAEPVLFQIPLPEKLTLPASGAFALSPDGRKLAFAAAGSDGVERLWVRALNSLEARPVRGSESIAPIPFFWSPDSRFIAFDTGGKLKRIDISGDRPETVCELIGSAVVGGSWNRDGVIIFGTVGGLKRVSADGGSASPLTVLDPSRDESRHIFPSFLPDGRHFIYVRRSTTSENSGVYVGSLDVKPEEQSLKLLVGTDFGPAYVPSPNSNFGQLLFVRDGALMAQPLDALRLNLSGEPVVVAEDVRTYLNYPLFSISSNGVLVYKAGGGQNQQLTWLDREGKTLGIAEEANLYNSVSLSPEGTRVVVSRTNAQEPNSGLWLLDVTRGTSTRFTFDSSISAYAVWSPDGNRIIFASNRGGTSNIYLKLASGVKDEELLLKSGGDKYPDSWSRDGRFLMYETRDPKTKYDLWVLRLDGDKKSFPFLRTEFNEQDGQFSPDGRWVAYVSDESGRREIYVRSFSPDSTDAGTAAKRLISNDGGMDPRWRGDGAELFYIAPDAKLMAVEVRTKPVLQAGDPKALFQAPPQGGTDLSAQWDLTPDAKHFLFVTPAAQTTSAPFTVVLNWQAGLKK